MVSNWMGDGNHISLGRDDHNKGLVMLQPKFITVHLRMKDI